jgi:MSHA biogenesis protein MshP
MTRLRSSGFGLPTAILLVVVLAAIGTGMISLMSSQATATSLDLQGLRAYQAARAGVEWGIYQQRIARSCLGSSNFVPPSGLLSKFTVSVACTKTDAGTISGVTTYRIVAVACNLPSGGACTDPPSTSITSADFVQRVVAVRFEDTQ